MHPLHSNHDTTIVKLLAHRSDLQVTMRNPNSYIKRITRINYTLQKCKNMSYVKVTTVQEGLLLIEEELLLASLALPKTSIGDL